MSTFIWQDECVLGHKRLDEQHKQLFSLAQDALQSESREELIRNMLLLYQHVREHFAAEEQFMKQSAYPELDRHIQTHNQMLTRLVQFSERIGRNDNEAEDIQAFMKSWIGHITEDDTRFSKFLLNAQS